VAQGAIIPAMVRLWLSAVVLGLLMLLHGHLAFAQYTSSGYQTNEFLFGTGGDPQLTSPNYQANASAGSLAVGEVSSSSYRAFSGFLTPNEPFLEMGIDSSLVNLGTLDTASTSTGSATFHVRAYLDSGYVVETLSQPPTVVSGNSHTLAAMTSAGSATAGTEQFGMNLRANTSPVNFGDDPSPQPDSSFANGQAATGYDTPNQFKYNVGDIVAQSQTSGWGLTNYTISYIANIAPLTPAGNYSMIEDLVAVTTY
jgi:hypothetical protein